MGVAIFTTVPSAAVVSGGTIAFALPATQGLGLFKLNGGHKLNCRGLNTIFDFPKDFTVSFSGSTATVTYNGVTSIPAGTEVQLQLEYAGDNDGRQLGINDWRSTEGQGRFMASLGNVALIHIGAPAVGAATTVVNAAARAAVGKTTYAAPVVLDVPRALTVKSSTTDTTQKVTIRGVDVYGQALSETLSLNGTSAVNGKKAFSVVYSDEVDIALAGNLSIGTQNVFGLPFFLPGGTSAGAGYVLKEVQDGAAATAGTFKGGDLTKATAATGDVRGTWSPNATPDGAKIFDIIVAVTDTRFLGVPQYGA